MSTQATLMWCPLPDQGTARKIVTALRDARLIARGNLFAGLVSIFSFQGQASQETECGALLKTTGLCRPTAVQRRWELHPYETPAILCWTAEVDEATLGWLEGETGQR